MDNDGSGMKTQALLKLSLAGPFAWFGGQSGQVGNEAATAVQKQCRSQARLLNFRPW